MLSKTFAFSLTLSFAVAFAGAARAERALRLADALELARANNRDLKAAKARMEQAHSGIELARVALLPIVSAQGKYTRNAFEARLDLSSQARLETLKNDVIARTAADLYTKIGQTPSADVLAAQQALADYVASQPMQQGASGSLVIQPFNQLDLVLAAQVPILVPSAYPGMSAAKRNYEAARGTYDASEASVLFAAAQAFFAAAGADELVGARTHAIDVARRTLNDAKARLDAGVVNRVEVRRAELSVVRAEQALKETVALRDQTYRSLATILQLREEFKVVSDARPALTKEPIETLRTRALELRPDFRAVELTLKAADATWSSQKWKWAPTLSAFGNFRAFNYPGFTGQSYAWAVGAQIDWLLYDGGARDGQRRQAEYQRREAEARQLALRDQISDEISNARQNVDTKREAVTAAQRSLELTKETLDLVRVQHEAGTATQLDLLVAQDALVSAEVGVAQARFDLDTATIALDRATGVFPPPASSK